MLASKNSNNAKLLQLQLVLLPALSGQPEALSICKAYGLLKSLPGVAEFSNSDHFKFLVCFYLSPKRLKFLFALRESLLEYLIGRVLATYGARRQQ